MVRPATPRGRRFVFAAAGAFSVAAVTMCIRDSVNPVRGPGGAVSVPGSGELSVDFPVYPVRASHGAGAVPPAPYGADPDAYQAAQRHQLR